MHRAGRFPQNTPRAQNRCQLEPGPGKHAQDLDDLAQPDTETPDCQGYTCRIEQGAGQKRDDAQDPPDSGVSALAVEKGVCQVKENNRQEDQPSAGGVRPE